MLRTHWITNASAAKKYYQFSDYHAEGKGEWLGEGARMLGLTGPADHEDFCLLCDNINPLTGESLTTYTRDNRRVAIDLNFNSTKSVGIVRELGGMTNEGDPRVEEANREAVAYAMSFVEKDMAARVRSADKNGPEEDRITGNMVAWRDTHRDTRVSGEDAMPDMSLHDHVVVFNATFDRVSDKWKAAQMGGIKHDAPYYEAIYHNRLASNLKELGYGIRRKAKSFEIEGVEDRTVDKYSRRHAYIKEVGEKLGIVSAAGWDALGATTRLGKTKQPVDNLNAYWVSRLTPAEKTDLRTLIGRNGYETTDERAMAYATGHLFERLSVVEARKLYETAMRHGIGSVTPESVMAEGQKQGLLLKDGLATTKEVLEQEGRVVAFAREGRGTCRGLRAGLDTGSSGFLLPARTPTGDSIRVSFHAAEAQSDLATLSDQQQAAVKHVWESPDRVILIRGGAGTGKTHMMKAAIAGIKDPVVVLAPSSDASRGVLRKEGFKDADTLARFLMDEKFQENARGGLIWVDEAGQVSMRQLDHLFNLADSLDARVVLQGDKKQHGAIERGATLRVLEEFAGLPVAELTDIKRQKGDYKQAVASIQKGDILAGYDKLASMGWVHQTPVFDHNKPLVDDYMTAVARGKSVLVVAPTHAEGDEITAEIRMRLKETPLRGKDGKVVKGKDKQPVMRLGGDEKVFDQLKPLAWTQAEKGDRDRYEGSEVIQFVRNSGKHRAGDRVAANLLLSDGSKLPGDHFAVYQPGQLALAPGDAIRITAGGKSKDGHRLDTGAVYAVKGFVNTADSDLPPSYDIELSNGWVLDGSKALHVAHAYTTTSHASQGKTVDRVLIAMGGESRPAINAEQFYVSASRGRESAQIYTNLSPATLREAIQKSDTRMTATELMKPAQKPKVKRVDKLKEFLKRVQKAIKRMRAREINEPTKERYYGIER